jgi:hypothetical protein
MYVKLPDPILFTKFIFAARKDCCLGSMPGLFKIYASTDGTSWNVLHTQSTRLQYSAREATVTVTATSAYSYVGFVVSAVGTSDANERLNIGRFRIFGVSFCAN